MRALRLALLLTLVLASTCLGQSPWEQTRRSHIEANVPPADKFDAYLKRDVLSYLNRKHPSVHSVECELLRRGPTQSGVALPKYYLWARAFDSEGQPLVEGAARVAAFERKGFDVTHFLPKDSIRKDSETVKSIFPARLVQGILERAE